MKTINPLRLAVLTCVFFSGCTHKLKYNSTSAAISETTVPRTIGAAQNFKESLQNSPTGNATKIPPYLTDHIVDSVHTAATFTTFTPVELAKPTLRDIPAISVNKSTDILHNGIVSVGRTVGEIGAPTAKALGRSTAKLGNLIILTPFKWMDDGVDSLVDLLNTDPPSRSFR